MPKATITNWSTIRPDLTDFDKPFDVKVYIENRVLFKIKLYYVLSKRCERFYKTIAVLILVFSASVPTILGISIIGSESMRMLLASVISFLVVVLFSIESVYNFREQWKSYKNAEDEITQELNLFHTSAEPYTNSKHEKEKLLVMRVESIVLRERKETIEKLTAKIQELEKSSHITGNSH